MLPSNSSLKVLILPKSSPNISLQGTKILVQKSNPDPDPDHDDDNGEGAAETGSWSIINLPHPRTLQTVKHLLYRPAASSGNAGPSTEENGCLLYELKQVNGSNPHLRASAKLETEFGDLIKSLLIEENKPKLRRSMPPPAEQQPVPVPVQNAGDDEQQDKPYNDNDKGSNLGIIVEDPTVLVATPYNIAYLLATYFTKTSNDSSNANARYVSLEDIIDSMSQHSLFSSSSNHHFDMIPASIIAAGLSLICDHITEGDGDKYFRFSRAKLRRFITGKVAKLAQSHNFPESILRKVVLPLLAPADVQSEVPRPVLRAARWKFGFSVICSYLCPEAVLLVLTDEGGGGDKDDGESDELDLAAATRIVDEHVDRQKQVSEAKRIAEENLVQMNQQFVEASQSQGSGKKSGGSGRKRGAAAAAGGGVGGKKKVAKKVARGALDSFFRKA